MKIAIAVTTTPNREQTFQKWLQAYKNHVPHIPLYIHNDTEYKGIVYSKNKCISALYDAGSTDLFLFDDDCIIQSNSFISAYVNSGLNHACWNYNKPIKEKHGALALLSNPQINIPEYYEYGKPNGCMLYVKSHVIDIVGGFDTDFNGYGYEHVNFSDRIFNNGLTPARYIDVPNSSQLFKMADCDTSVSYQIRASTIPINERLYKEKFYSKEFKPFK